LSYRAFQSFLQTNQQSQAEVPTIFGMTHEQLFFVAYGQAWCGKVTPQRADYLLNNDVHSPYKARVNLPLSQFDEFAKAFGCPADAPMNPSSRCLVW
jgi:endothelin-converting enzyme